MLGIDALILPRTTLIVLITGFLYKKKSRYDSTNSS